MKVHESICELSRTQVKMLMKVKPVYPRLFSGDIMKYIQSSWGFDGLRYITNLFCYGLSFNENKTNDKMPKFNVVPD